MNRIPIVFLLILNYSVSFGQVVYIDTARNITRNGGSDISPAWSPDSKSILYQTDRNGNWDIYAYNLEKDTTLRYTYSEQNEQHPLWHPHKNVIIYDAGAGLSQFIYKLNLTTGKMSPLFNREVICKQASLAPDGRMVYFLGIDAQHDNWELFSYHFIYDNLNQLTNFKEDGLFLDLSPDGKSVCYSYISLDYPFHRLQILNWYGNMLEQFDEFNISNAIWHPDGLKIYFISDRDHQEGELYSIWKDGTHLIRLTDDDFRMQDFSISPDGKWIACSVFLNGNYEIMILPLESF